MQKKRRELGELEFTILELIKERKMASVTDIHSALNKESAYTTIMTVMDRLYKKGYIGREKRGRSYFYWIEKKQKGFSHLLNRLHQKLFYGKSLEMISYLIENSSDLSMSDLEKMQELIEKAKRKK